MEIKAYLDCLGRFRSLEGFDYYPALPLMPHRGAHYYGGWDCAFAANNQLLNVRYAMPIVLTSLIHDEHNNQPLGTRFQAWLVASLVPGGDIVQMGGRWNKYCGFNLRVPMHPHRRNAAINPIVLTAPHPAVLTRLQMYDGALANYRAFMGSIASFKTLVPFELTGPGSPAVLYVFSGLTHSPHDLVRFRMYSRSDYGAATTLRARTFRFQVDYDDNDTISGVAGSAHFTMNDFLDGDMLLFCYEGADIDDSSAIAASVVAKTTTKR